MRFVILSPALLLAACQGDGEKAPHASHDASAVAAAVRAAADDPDAFVEVTRSSPAAACGRVETRGVETTFVVDMKRGVALIAGGDSGVDALVATACSGAVAAGKGGKGGEKSGGGGH
ncbi:MAG: hypothetical protein K2Q06_14410 [Parvularculaceae bacterium]|nr:hypothetical protein [Parvularculaceae bacterium]